MFSVSWSSAAPNTERGDGGWSRPRWRGACCCTGQTSPEVSPRASAGLQASVENDLLQRSFLQNAVFPSQNTELMWLLNLLAGTLLSPILLAPWLGPRSNYKPCNYLNWLLHHLQPLSVLYACCGVIGGHDLGFSDTNLACSRILRTRQVMTLSLSQLCPKEDINHRFMGGLTLTQCCKLAVCQCQSQCRQYFIDCT